MKLISYKEAVAKAEVLAERRKIIDQKTADLENLKASTDLTLSRGRGIDLIWTVVNHGYFDSMGYVDHTPEERALMFSDKHEENDFVQLFYDALVQGRTDELLALQLAYAAELSQ